jgi:hypothetical protein
MRVLDEPIRSRSPEDVLLSLAALVSTPSEGPTGVRA